MRYSSAVALLLVVACAPERSLLVQLTSDFAPGREIDQAHVVIAIDGRVVDDETVPLASTRSLGRPSRLTSLTGLAPGRYAIRVTLSRGSAEVQQRELRRDVDGRTVVTLLMTRECAGVHCPAMDGDPTAVACLGGRCVPDTCDEEHPELCASPQCHVDADCETSTACAPARCSASGTCFASADDTRCAAGQTCDTAIGCVSASSCTLGAWGTPRELAELDSPQVEYIGEVRPDGLTVYFASNRTGDYDLYRATRPTRSAAFDAPVRVAELDDALYQGDSATTSDELQLVYANADCLDVASRARATDPWARTGPLGASCTPDVILGGPAFTLDSLTLYYTRFARAPLETNSLWTMTRASTRDPFGPATPVPGYDDATNSGYVGLSADHLTMWLEQHTATDVDITVTTRATTSSPWPPAARFDAASSVGFDDADPTITGDGLELFFSSTRPGGTGERDIWVITRSCN